MAVGLLWPRTSGRIEVNDSRHVKVEGAVGSGIVKEAMRYRGAGSTIIGPDDLTQIIDAIECGAYAAPGKLIPGGKAYSVR
jgi:hypothetical protein